MRLLSSFGLQGKWRAEEDAALRQLLEQHGRKWALVGAAVGRMPESCRDRWRSIFQARLAPTAAPVKYPSSSHYCGSTLPAHAYVIQGWTPAEPWHSCAMRLRPMRLPD